MANNLTAALGLRVHLPDHTAHRFTLAKILRASFCNCLSGIAHGGNKILTQQKGQRAASGYQERYPIILFQGLLAQVWYYIDRQRLHRIESCLNPEGIGRLRVTGVLMHSFKPRSIPA